MTTLSMINQEMKIPSSRGRRHSLLFQHAFRHDDEHRSRIGIVRGSDRQVHQLSSRGSFSELSFQNFTTKPKLNIVF